MAGSDTFTFKRFAVSQHGCAMKVGTDGVLLGAWCRLDGDSDRRLLDVGTGTGVIALQLAQRTEGWGAAIDAVELDPAASLVARANFAASGWGDRLALHNTDVKPFAAADAHRAAYYHVVSNPPYFVGSLTSPDAARTAARHTASLAYDDLVACCARLLRPSGRVSLVLPAGAETERMTRAAADHGFHVSRLTEVHSTPRSGPRRTLLEFSRHQPAAPRHAPEHTTLVIAGSTPGTFSDEYRALTRDFYLRF